jgi:MEMO1 family protein
LKSILKVIMLIVLTAILPANAAIKKDADSSSHSAIRTVKDTVGFATNVEQIEKIVALSLDAENEHIAANAQKYDLSPQTNYIAGVSPHDDYLTAGPVYAHLYPYIKAKRVVIFGVAHYAAHRKVDNKLIFDSFKSWTGPYGPAPVSDVRERVLKHLSPESVLVSDAMQAEEHSVEALIPWLQHFNRDVEIVSILVPHMRFSKMDSLAAELAIACESIITENNWQLGKDIAFLISNDGSHYGDQGWGGKNYAPFGAGCEGLIKASERDILLAKETLCGELSTEKSHEFYDHVLQPGDYYTYQMTWCGRFAVPFGCDFLSHLAHKLGRKSFAGDFLRYNNSVSIGELDARDLGLGLTTSVSLHHWVGWLAIGYR